MAQRNRGVRNGFTGLGILSMLSVALVSAEVSAPGAGYAGAGATPAGTAAEWAPLPEAPPAKPARGAIREFRVLPSELGQMPELDWTPDEILLDKLEGRGF